MAFYKEIACVRFLQGLLQSDKIVLKAWTWTYSKQNFFFPRWNHCWNTTFVTVDRSRLRAFERRPLLILLAPLRVKSTRSCSKCRKSYCRFAQPIKSPSLATTYTILPSLRIGWWAVHFFYGTSFSQNYVTLAKEASPSNCTAHLINTIVFKTKGRKAFATVYMFPILLLRLSVSNIQIDSLSP